MGMHFCVVSIKGDRLPDISTVLKQREYVIEESFTVTTGEAALGALAWNPDHLHVAKVAYVANGWTFIIDPEAVLAFGDEWLEYSKARKVRTITWICLSESRSCQFNVFDSGLIIRGAISSRGRIAVKEVNSATIESGKALGEGWKDDIVGISQHICAEIESMPDQEYVVFRLDESQISPPDEASSKGFPGIHVGPDSFWICSAVLGCVIAGIAFLVAFVASLRDPELSFLGRCGYSAMVGCMALAASAVLSLRDHCRRSRSRKPTVVTDTAGSESPD